MRHTILSTLSLAFVLTQSACEETSNSDNVLSLEQLGSKIFFDTRLSANFNQACSSCHGPEVGFTGPALLANLEGGIYDGSIHNRNAGRKAPSSAYNVFAPPFSLMDDEFVGGNFWDGRATGWRLGTPAADQAQGPFLNPVEQGLADASIVVDRVCASSYGLAFEGLWGADACLNRELGYDDVALSIAAFETSLDSSRFQSKYDAFLRGEATLSAEEAQGLALFDTKANCSACHVLANAPGVELPGPLFTDFTYDNPGVPRNVSNPFYRMDGVEVNGQPINPLGFAWIDPGLGGFIEQLAADDSWCGLPHVPESMLQFCDDDGAGLDLDVLAAAARGKHKVPTLRNVALRPYPSFVKSYTHNGYFKTLKGLVHFYNTRDVLDTCRDAKGQAADYPEAVALALDCWPPPEVADNVNHEEVGELSLTDAEEDAVVAFLETLSDGFVPE